MNWRLSSFPCLIYDFSSKCAILEKLFVWCSEKYWVCSWTVFHLSSVLEQASWSLGASVCCIKKGCLKHVNYVAEPRQMADFICTHKHVSGHNWIISHGVIHQCFANIIFPMWVIKNSFLIAAEVQNLDPFLSSYLTLC